MKLPKFLRVATQTLGFTMIELLVVISVIGVLAVAVLSSINPIEQINKGRDTRTRSDAAQLINASDRFIAIQEMYPWNATSTTYAPPPGQGGEASFGVLFEFDGPNSTPNEWNWVDTLVNTNEVKQGYINRVKQDAKMYVYKALGDNETMFACFEPDSQAFKLEAATKCNEPSSTVPAVVGDIFCPSRGTTTAAMSPWICLP